MAFGLTTLRHDLCLRWVLLGAIPTIVWCCVEVGLRLGGNPIAGLLLACMLGGAVGGWLGLLACAIGSERIRAAFLLIPLPVFHYREVHWLIQRTAELVQLAGTISVLTVALILGVIITFSIRTLGRRVFPHSRGWPTFAAICVGFISVVVALLPLQRYAEDLARVIPYFYLVLGTTVLIGGWYRKWIYPALMLLGGGCLLRLREPYLELALIVGWITIAISMLTMHVWVPVSRESRLSFTTWTILAAFLIGLGWGAHHLVRTNPSAWRNSKGRGMLSMLIDLGHRWSDVDGDGYGTIFAQVDCEPFDPSAFPGAHEIPGNNSDENCLAGPARGNTKGWVKAQEALNSRPPAWRGDIVVVLVDTLRFDDAMSPGLVHFRELIRSGLNYERAYSPSSFTIFVIPSLFAARLPSTFPITWLGTFAGVPSITLDGLPAMLLRAGYDTAMAGDIVFPKSPYFSSDIFGNGFRIIRRTELNAPPSRLQSEALAAWRSMDTSKPRFLYVHFLWVHAPQKDRKSYRRAIREVDIAFGALREAIGNDEVLWVLLSDHGDEFGEHGGRYHASTLFEELVHVPLVIAVPNIEPRTIKQVSPTRSLMPTLMAMVEPENTPPGKGPYLCLNQPQCTDLPVPMALEMRDIHLHGLLVGDRKIIRDVRRDQLFAYDLVRDPGEHHPLDPVPQDLIDALLGWEENVFGVQTSDHFWPYELKAEPFHRVQSWKELDRRR